MVTIQLDLESRMFQCGQNPCGFLNRGQIVTGKITIVDWLDEKLQIGGLTKCKFKVGKKCCAGLFLFYPVGYSCHHMQTAGFQNAFVLERLLNRIADLLFSALKPYNSTIPFPTIPFSSIT